MRRKVEDKQIKDNLGKKWQAHFWVNRHSLFVELENYGEWYPRDLLFDDKVALEVNLALKSLGYRGKHLLPLRPGLKENELEFEKSEELSEFINRNWKDLPVENEY